MDLETWILIHLKESVCWLTPWSFPVEGGGHWKPWQLHVKVCFQGYCAEKKCNRITPQKYICYLLGLGMERGQQARQTSENLLKNIVGEVVKVGSFR